MRRQQGRDFSDDSKKNRFAGSGAPAGRGGYEGRGGSDSRGGSEGRGGYAPRGGYEGRGGSNGGAQGGSRPPYRGQDDRGQGGFERSNNNGPAPRNTYRRDEGAPGGGFGRPSRPASNDAPRSQAPAAAAAPRPMAAPVSRPVPVARLKEGVAQANRALAEVIEQFGSTLSGDYDISALEVMVSFSEDGRFIGFGQGGAATMTLSVTPLSAEEILEGENDAMDEDFDGGLDMSASELIDADEDEEESAELDVAEPEAPVMAAPAPVKAKAKAKKSSKKAAAAKADSTDSASDELPSA